MNERRTAAHNKSLAKAAVQFSADTFVVNHNLVLRINPAEMRDGENRHLRLAAKRYSQCIE